MLLIFVSLAFFLSNIIAKPSILPYTTKIGALEVPQFLRYENRRAPENKG